MWTLGELALKRIGTVFFWVGLIGLIFAASVLSASGALALVGVLLWLCPTIRGLTRWEEASEPPEPPQA